MTKPALHKRLCFVRIPLSCFCYWFSPKFQEPLIRGEPSKCSYAADPIVQRSGSSEYAKLWLGQLQSPVSLVSTPKPLGLKKNIYIKKRKRIVYFINFPNKRSLAKKDRPGTLLSPRQLRGASLQCHLGCLSRNACFPSSLDSGRAPTKPRGMKQMWRNKFL